MGRFCQLRGAFLGGIALDGEALAEEIGFVPWSAESLSPSNGEGLSFVGELFGEVGEPVKRSNAPSMAASRRFSLSPSSWSNVGDKVSERLLDFVAKVLEAGVFAGEALVGDIERARSGNQVSLEVCHHKKSRPWQ